MYVSVRGMVNSHIKGTTNNESPFRTKNGHYRHRNPVANGNHQINNTTTARNVKLKLNSLTYNNQHDLKRILISSCISIISNLLVFD